MAEAKNPMIQDPMTVGDLRRLIQDLSDDLPVNSDVIEGPDEYTAGVRSIEVGIPTAWQGVANADQCNGLWLHIVISDMDEGEGDEYTIHHHLQCEHCGADLTQPSSVDVSLSDSNRVYDTIRTCVEAETGRLIDPDGRINDLGHHAGSECAKCGELLEEVRPRPLEPGAKWLDVMARNPEIGGEHDHSMDA